MRPAAVSLCLMGRAACGEEALTFWRQSAARAAQLRQRAGAAGDRPVAAGVAQLFLRLAGVGSPRVPQQLALTQTDGARVETRASQVEVRVNGAPAVARQEGKGVWTLGSK